MSADEVVRSLADGSGPSPASGSAPADGSSDMTAAAFAAKTGRPPELDDLERVNCAKAGQIMHWQCGWCAEHDSPRFECGCLAKLQQKDA